MFIMHYAVLVTHAFRVTHIDIEISWVMFEVINGVDSILYVLIFFLNNLLYITQILLQGYVFKAT